MELAIIVFAWLVLMIAWVVFKMIRDYLKVKKKEKSYRFKQVVYKNGRKMYRVNHISGKGFRW